MAEEKEFNEKLFLKGFNIGYSLNESEPTIYKTLMASTKHLSNDYIDGLRDGGWMYERDKAERELQERLGYPDNRPDYEMDR